MVGLDVRKTRIGCRVWYCRCQLVQWTSRSDSWETFTKNVTVTPGRALGVICFGMPEPLQ